MRDYGEVFTPKKIVNDILDMPGMDEASQRIETRFLEPAAGEGVFLVQILLRKLSALASEQGSSLTGFENYSLLALSTLYGIELLEDNSQRCVMNLFEAYYKFYQKEAQKHNKDVKENVLQSAKYIISKNIVQGDFLKRTTSAGQPIVFTEWKITNPQKETQKLWVQITEYTLEEIFNKAASELQQPPLNGTESFQMTLFGNDALVQPVTHKQYRQVPITEVYKEEEIDESGSN